MNTTCPPFESHVKDYVDDKRKNCVLKFLFFRIWQAKHFLSTYNMYDVMLDDKKGIMY